MNAEGPGEPGPSRDPEDPRRKRLSATIFVSAAAGTTALYGAYTLSPIVAGELTSAGTLTGVPATAALVGTALSASLLSNRMATRGRRLPLAAGWGLGMIGALLSILAVGVGSLLLLVAGLFLIGCGHASNQLSRFAVADMHPVERRPIVLGWIVWASTFGAALGPGLLRTSGWIEDKLGLSPLGGGFLVSALFFAFASTTALTLRPDPSSFSAETPDQLQAGPAAPPLADPEVRMSLIALIAAQGSMILVMTMTPLHLREGGHGLGLVGWVMSAHLVAMFAFAPLMGRVTARLGHRRTIFLGGALLVAAAMGAAAGSNNGTIVGMSLFLSGLGWCSAFVAGSSRLTKGLGYAARTRLQGRVDATVWGTSAVASLISGIVNGSLGYAWLGLIAACVALVPVVATALSSPSKEVDLDPRPV